MIITQFNLEQLSSYLENISLRYFHNMVIHFPIAYCALLTGLLGFQFIKKNKENRSVLISLKILLALSIVLANWSGRYTAQAIGLLIDENAWNKENFEIAQLVLTHRFFGTVATLYWLILIVSDVSIQVKKENFYNQKVKMGILVLYILGTVLIWLNALIGSHIGG